ncbi:MAG: coenzyme Q-binding protein, partial [Alphaproteobacteria bacterium]|nr:coenzyme Q-binding protein [Alphaproteobacteria bacterium]
RVTLDRPNLHILVEYLEGPFKKMQNRWVFNPTGAQSCRV